jgi:hypothetical protein
MAPVGLLEAKERGTRNVVVTDIYQGTSQSAAWEVALDLDRCEQDCRCQSRTVGVKDCRCQAFVLT